MEQPQRVNVNVDTRDLPTSQCDCGTYHFETVFLYKLLPALYSPTGKEQLLSIPHAQCINCGSVHSMEELIKMAKGKDLQ